LKAPAILFFRYFNEKFHVCIRKLFSKTIKTELKVRLHLKNGAKCVELTAKNLPVIVLGF
jgi:hypothetical protein